MMYIILYIFTTAFVYLNSASGLCLTWFTPRSRAACVFPLRLHCASAGPPSPQSLFADWAGSGGFFFPPFALGTPLSARHM